MEPWLGELVVVGGWAHRLYRLDPRARKLDYCPRQSGSAVDLESQRIEIGLPLCFDLFGGCC